MSYINIILPSVVNNSDIPINANFLKLGLLIISPDTTNMYMKVREHLNKTFCTPKMFVKTGGQHQRTTKRL